MKYMKRSKVYKASNVEFNPETKIALSYNWWQFVKPINGKLVFNNYSYSSTTRGHQYETKRLLETLGYKIDIMIESPRGLQDIQSAITFYKVRIETLEAEMKKPRTQKKKNYERASIIYTYMNKIEEVKKLLGDK
jgi:hypothetical protein